MQVKKNINKEKERIWGQRSYQKRKKSGKLEKWYKKHIQTPQYRFQKYRYDAKIRKIKFDLSLKFFERNVNKNCYYCGQKNQVVRLDRVDNQRGYISTNIVNCCACCNKMKYTMTIKEFINKCRQIINFWDNKNK